MKKTIISILTLAMLLFLCACSDRSDMPKSENNAQVAAEPQAENTTTPPEESNTEYAKIGDTIANDNFELTLINAEFADSINMNQESENFCTPMSEEERTADPAHSLIGQDGNTMISYEFEFKFIGHSEMKDHFHHFGQPHVAYDGDYFFEESYMSFVRNDAFPDWHFQATDESEASIQGIGVDNIIFSSGIYKALKDETHHVRGFIAVPEKVREDSENTLTISFANLTDESFTIR